MVSKLKHKTKPYQTTKPSTRPGGGLLGNVAGILDPPRERPFIRPFSFNNPLNLFKYGLKQIPNEPVKPRSRYRSTTSLEEQFKRGSKQKHQPVYPNWNRPRRQQPLDLSRDKDKTKRDQPRPSGIWPTDKPKPDIPTPPVHVIPDWPGWPTTPIEDEPVPNIPEVPWEEPEEPLNRPREVAKLCSDDPMEQLLYKLPPCSLSDAEIQISTEKRKLAKRQKSS